VSFWRSIAATLGLASARGVPEEVVTEQGMKLVVGLGNHGSKYTGTRHNIGYEVVDELAERLGGVSFRRQFSGRAGGARSGDEALLLLKPETYMNESGRSVQAALAFHRLPAAQLLVICDDLNLPVGKLRIRSSGSDGGQKGLRSIAQHLGTQDYPRLRVGIGAPQGVDSADYVLTRFSRAERDQMNAAVEQAVDAVIVWCQSGIESCMNRFN
jgi:PTH1 family peptidyl-tRNA hydrolase